MSELSPVAARDVPTSPPPGNHRFRRRLRDPAAVFAVVALVVGGYLACVVPHFAGIDEPAHFYRSYQISTGRLLPLHPDGSAFSGACIPSGVVRGVLRDRRTVAEHNTRLAGLPAGTVRRATVDDAPRCPGDSSRRFVTFSTFGSPVPYAPQAAAMFVARSLGAGVYGMLLGSRLAELVVYVGLVWWAIRRATRSPWALCAVALIPVALFQASVSESHDALTIAISLLVVSSALRLVDVGDATTLRRALGEAMLLTLLLAACKPGYVVLSACYLLPLLGRANRREWWPLVALPCVGVVASLVWNELVGGLWRTDADLFAVAVDPDRQRSLLLHQPWHFVDAVARTVVEQLDDWGKGLIVLGPSVAVWPLLAVVVFLVVLALVSVQSSPGEPDALSPLQRVLLALVFIAGCLLVLGAQYVYWSAPGDDVVGGMQARFFVPLLVLVPIVVGPRRGAWASSTTARVPLTVLLLACYVAFLVTVAFRMY